jgi:hypothetical protein
MPYVDTVPVESKESDHKEWGKVMDSRKYVLQANDPRFTGLISVLGISLAGLITAGVVALFSLNSNVAVLLQRPLGIPREEYTQNERRRDADTQEMKAQLGNLAAEVGHLREAQRK